MTSIALAALKAERASAERQRDAARAAHSAAVRKANLEIESAATTAEIYEGVVREYGEAIAILEGALR